MLVNQLQLNVATVGDDAVASGGVVGGSAADTRGQVDARFFEYVESDVFSVFVADGSATKLYAGVSSDRKTLLITHEPTLPMQLRGALRRIRARL